MVDKPDITKETFELMNQRGRDGVLFDLITATYSRVDDLEKTRDITYEKLHRKAKRIGALSGAVGGIGTVLVYLFGTGMGAPW